MHSKKIAMIASAIRRHTLLQATIPGNASLGGCVSFGSGPPEGGCECAGEKAKQTMDNVLGAAKEGSEKLKDRAAGTGTGTCTGTSAGTGTGTGTGTSKPSKDPDMNHGVESTDSSCEDVRGRPGGYN